jgi:TldD protein
MTFNPAVFRPFLLRGDFADLYLEESDHVSLRWEDGRVREAVHGSGGGAGFRCWKGEETRFGSVDGGRVLSRGLGERPARRLAELAKGLTKDLSRMKRPPRFGPPSVRRHSVLVSPARIPLERKAGLLAAAAKAAKISTAVEQVTVTYSDRVKRVGYVNSRGESFFEERVYVVFAVEVTAKRNGLRQTGREIVGGLQGLEVLDRLPPEEAARIAARRAVAKLSAPPAPLGEMDVVIASEAGGTLIHEAIGHALEADTIQQGASPFFAGRIGKAVAGEKVSVLDDPTLPGHRGSFHYDDEGTPSERTVLVENGVLRTYLYDRMSAKKAGRRSNGHGRRESYAFKPIPRMSNTFIAPGKESPQEIVRSLKKGLLVTRMGGGQVNPATGDFVFEVEDCFRVENGRVKNRVRGASLLGSTGETLKRIDRVGSDIGWSIGTCGKDGQGAPVSDGVPTVRVGGLVVGGTKRES